MDFEVIQRPPCTGDKKPLARPIFTESPQMFSIDLVDAVGDTIRCSFYLRRRGEVETMLPVAYSRHEWLQILHGMSTDERHAALKALKRTTLSVGTDNTSRGSGPFSVVSTSCRATWRTRIARTCAELLEYCTEVCGQGRGPIRSDSGAGRGIVMRLREHNAGPRDRDAVAVSNFFFDKLPNKLLARPHPPRSLLEDGDVEPNPGPKANDYCELAQLVAEEVEDYCQAVDEHGAKSSEMGWNADAPKSARRRQFGH